NLLATNFYFEGDQRVRRRALYVSPVQVVTAVMARTPNLLRLRLIPAPCSPSGYTPQTSTGIGHLAGESREQDDFRNEIFWPCSALMLPSLPPTLRWQPYWLLQAESDTGLMDTQTTSRLLRCFHRSGNETRFAETWAWPKIRQARREAQT